MKTGYRYAGFAWAIYRILSGSVFLTLLWLVTKLVYRRLRKVFWGAKKRTG